MIFLNKVLMVGPIAGMIALASCVTSGNETEKPIFVKSSQSSCEVSFSMLPHKLAIHKLGAKRLLSLDDVRSSFENERRFIESFDAITKQVIKAATQGADGYEDVKIQTVYGGYEGFTSPSLSARFDADTQEERNVVKNISAALGYVYLQDSVLVQCDVLDEGEEAVFAYDMTESGPVDAINPITLKSIYGMMIGQANGNLDLGFSYYEGEDRFSVLGFDKNGKESNALDGVIQTIETLTQNEDQITLTKVPKWVSFPSNNWGNFPEGQNYLSSVNLGNAIEDLNDLQSNFITEIDMRIAQ